MARRPSSSPSGYLSPAAPRVFAHRGLAIDADGDALVLGALASENRADGARLWLRKYVAAAAP